MGLSRRALLAALTAGASRLAAQPKVRTGPLICLYSRLLPQVELYDVGKILSSMGFDGCDLSVQPGGTVLPQQTAVDLVRIVESLTGSGLEVPVITTSFLSPVEPWARNVIYVAGGTGVPYWRPGLWKYSARPLAEIKTQIAGLASLGRAYGMAMGIPNTAGAAVIRDLDPQWVGWDFDPSQVSAEIGLEAALPRLKMIILRDVRRNNGQFAPCPLGQGIVDWPKFFATLAGAKFSGPLSLQLDYQTPDPLDAIRHDLEFARKELNTAYQKPMEPTSHPTSNEPLAGLAAP